jgi:hypothetical protein
MVYYSRSTPSEGYGGSPGGTRTGHFLGGSPSNNGLQIGLQIQQCVYFILQIQNCQQMCKNSLEYGWTKTHGFFAVMGGFMLFKGENQTTSSNCMNSSSTFVKLIS